MTVRDWSARLAQEADSKCDVAKIPANRRAPSVGGLFHFRRSARCRGWYIAAYTVSARSLRGQSGQRSVLARASYDANEPEADKNSCEDAPNIKLGGEPNRTQLKS